jgi:adenosine deaminase CECR1
MPKGALLHAHLEATIDAATLLKIVLDYANICIKVSNTVNKSNLVSIVPEFEAFPIEEDHASSTSPVITAPDYAPDTWVPTQKVRQEWPEDLGGPIGFDQWIVRTLTINPQEAYGTHNTTVKVNSTVYFVSLVE